MSTSRPSMMSSRAKVQNVQATETEDHGVVSLPDLELFTFTQSRELYGCRPFSVSSRFLSYQLPRLLKEKELRLGQINKIFASQWVTDHHVAFGTKCNQLFVIDLATKQIVHIPSLKSSDHSVAADSPCGIHSIAVNPSNTLLATGADNVNDLAVYKLPSFDPLAVGEGGHSDWIFDLKWLDDQFIVSGSRDSQLILWQIDDDSSRSPVFPSSSDNSTAEGLFEEHKSPVPLPEHSFCTPVVARGCSKADKIRALAYSTSRMEVAALSLNAHIHLWDAATFTQTSCRKLQHIRENVCLTVNNNSSLYAVGSLSVVTLIDPRVIKTPSYVPLRQMPCGIRSLNFLDDVLTIGTGNGYVHFYDIRAGRLLELGCGHPCSLAVGNGWLKRDEIYEQIFSDSEYPNAVYTHSFDASGTRMFAAGGPLPVGLWGNYAAVWQ